MMNLQILIINLVMYITLSQVEFICNNYKNQANCEGATASDGICGWGLFGCSSVAPLPSPTIATVEAPALVCPPYTAEATCNNDPCATSSVCFTNNAARCVVNNCVGDFEYLGRILRQPCSAVYVDVDAMSIVDCNVKEIIREVDEEALADFLEQKSQPQDIGTKSAIPSPAVSEVDSTMLGLAPETTPSPVPETTPSSVNGPTIGLPQPQEPTPTPTPTPAPTTGPRVGLPPFDPPTPTTSEIDDTTEEQQGGPTVGLPPLGTPTPTTSEEEGEDEEQETQTEFLTPEPEPESGELFIVDGVVGDLMVGGEFGSPEPEVEIQVVEEEEEGEQEIVSNEEQSTAQNVSSSAPLQMVSFPGSGFVLPRLSVGTIVLDDEQESQEDDISPSPKPNGDDSEPEPTPRPRNNRRNNNNRQNNKNQGKDQDQATVPAVEEREN